MRSIELVGPGSTAILLRRTLEGRRRAAHANTYNPDWLNDVAQRRALSQR